MQYKLMAVDVDGTLFNSNNEISKETKEAIGLAVDKGLIFTICSGRPIQGVEGIINTLGLNLPFITYNGAMVVMGKSREILYEQKLSKEDAKNIIALGNKFNVTVVVWVNNQLYVNRMDEKAQAYSKQSKTPPIVIQDIDNIIKDGVTKILWYDEIETINRLEKEVGSMVSENVNYHTSKPIFLEFVDKKASKAIAMEKLGAHFGIGQQEMIAVGDGFNDLSMIQYAGLGVAMANAKEEIKQKADFVTHSNDENGVAHVIYEFVLK